MAQIDKPTDYFNTVLYTGNGSTQSITGVGFQPDMVWVKKRNNADNHALHDVIRGTTKYISSDNNAAEATWAGGLTSFDSDGYSLGVSNFMNQNTHTFVSWNWKANGAGSSNSDGTITATVSANTTSGFSIVKYTGNATNSTVGHGLGVKPQVVIVKNLDSSGGSAEHWRVQHHKVSASKVLYLNQSVVEDTNGDFQSTYPTNSVFSISSADGCNKNGEENIAYCFAEKKGFSHFGSYTGNGNVDGPFVYTGFSPAYVWIKSKTYAGNWLCLDNKREIKNIGSGTPINLNESNAEDTNANYAIDFLSNGFKLRNNNGNIQNNDETMVYMAFAKHPIVGSNNIPATAR